MAKLIDKETKQEIKIGDKVLDFRGKPAKVIDIEPPRHEASEGRIRIKEIDGSEHSYYPSVYGAQIVED